MHQIKVFSQEIADGISEQIQTTASIAYCTPFSVMEAKNEVADVSVIEQLLAENKDQVDLYYLESVLVSTNWNRNDDVFLPAVTWAARNTPEDKQFNFMHDENDIIGHITGSYVVDRDGNKVEGDEMPADFDIITRAVLYNSWMNTENRERMQQIIADIDEDKWFVSMECLFSGFDYAVIDTNGSQQVIDRNEASAFLTKHLRAYGGTGEYEGYRIGRALRDISFSGKGLVSNPANPRSIILNSKSIAFSVNNTSSIEETNMSESQVQEDQLVEEPVVAEELTEEVVETVETEAVEAEEVTTEEVAETATEEVAEDVTESEEVVAEEETTEEVTEAEEIAEEETVATTDKEDEDDKKKKKDEESMKKYAVLEASLEAAEAKIVALEALVAKSTEDLQSAQSELNDMKKKQKEEKRKAALIEAGIATDDADATLASFDALDDEAFDAVVALYAAKSVATKSVETEEVVEAETVEAAEIFDEVETAEATLVEAEEAEEVQSARASIAEYISNSILSK